MTSRRGFTIIELMIAISISLMIIYLAYSAFAMASTSLRQIQRISEENRQLRTGMTMIIDATDFWRMEADPGFPYAKNYMAWENVPANTAGHQAVDAPLPAGSARDDHLYNRRIFRPVGWDSDGPRNPNNNQPHRLEFWYRNHLWPNNRPISTSHSHGRWEIYYNEWYDDKDTSSQNKGDYAPKAWGPRHWAGDYSLTSCIDMEANDQAWGLGLTPADKVMRQTRPEWIMELFRELGLYGVALYSPPGTVNQILAPSHGLKNWASGSGVQYFVGEIPWSTADTGKGSHKADIGTYVTTFGGAAPPAADIPMPNLSNYGHALMLNKISGSFEKFAQKRKQWSQAMDWTSYSAEHLMFFPSARSRYYSGGTKNRDTLITASCVYPFIETTDHVGGSEAALMGRLYKDYSHSLWLYPLTPANQELPDTTTDADKPSLMANSYRYRRGTSPSVLCRVQVTDPQMGRATNIYFNMSTTTFRGARQHWGLKSWQPGSRTSTMGDYYR